ncbi:MAG TPA: hypothetical protein VFM83_08320 [Gaiellaceae bacterium]|nr:hypothetical protein [Gaiellaceae bacterium]
MHELGPGLWHWEAPHPQWEPTEPWGPSVSSYAIDDGRRLLLFDLLALPDELEALAADRETAIVLTAPWHERDTQSLVERIDAPVYVPPPDTQEDLTETYGLTAEQARTWCCGSRARTRSSPATQSSTGARAFRSTPGGSART